MDKRQTLPDMDILLERAVGQIAEAVPDAATTTAAAARVRERLAAGADGNAALAASIEQISGCGDYQALLPAYLEGSLPEARRLLLEDHTRECVPCRRALKEARSGKGQPLPPALGDFETEGGGGGLRWALAAMLAAGLGLALFLVWQTMPFGSGASAVLESAQGDLFRVSSSSQIPLEPGAVIREGERVRTDRAGGAVIRLDDGSLVEMRSRSELLIDEKRRGTTLELTRGSVIVQAADQRERKLYVSTEDCLVSVVGTIFSVDHGTKGSRVSVIEGEVRVDLAGEEKVLQPGDQLATHAKLVSRPIAEEISWSQDVDRYITLLQELSALRRDIQGSLAASGLRYDSRLLDLMPEDTIVYAAMPNLPSTVEDVYTVIQQRVEQSEVLRLFWEAQVANSGFQEQVEEVVAVLGDLGDYLGGEIAVGGMLATAGQAMGPVVLAELQDGAGFQAALEEKMREWGQGGRLTFLTDPLAPAVGEGPFFWIRDDLAVASAQLDRVRQVARLLAAEEGSPFIGSPFHAEIASLYGDGAEILVAANLETVLTTTFPVQGESSERLDALGLNAIKHVVLERKHSDGTGLGQVHHRAALSFREDRSGLASWIAEPAPMGSLGFISPDAKLFSAFVFKDPVALLADIQEFLPAEGFAEVLRTLQGEYGINLEEDFAQALGGEIAVAIDGPLLPTPSWKAVIETYDPARVQWVFEQLVAEANKALTENGDAPLEIVQSEMGGRTFYSLPVEILEVHYTFVEGYLVVAPSRALLDRAIRFQQAGHSIVTSERFSRLLPTDSRPNFSALIYQDLVALVGPLAEKFGEGMLSPEQQEALTGLKAENGATLGYIYGEPRRITLAMAGELDLLSAGVLAMLGFENPVGIDNFLQQAVGGS